MKRFLFFAIPFLSLVGCNVIQGNKITVVPDSITVESDSTYASFIIESTSAWVLRTDDSGWLTFDITEGDAGAHRVNIEFEINTDTSARVAYIDILSAETVRPFIITQLGKNGSGGIEPDTVVNRNLIRSISIKSIEGDTLESWYLDFRYDTEGRVVDMYCTIREDVDYPEDEDVMSYHVEYAVSKVIITGTGSDSEAGVKHIVELDDSRRIVEVSTIADFHGSGRTRFFYDENGLKKVEEYSADWVEAYQCQWSNGNIVRINDNSYSCDFVYSEYENNANIDFNWFFQGDYGSFLFSVLDVSGCRSKNLIVPSYFGSYAEYSPEVVEVPVCEDMIGKHVFNEYDRTDSDYLAVTGDFEFDINGNVVRILSETPVWKTVYRQTKKINLVDGTYFEVGEDGKKYYWDVDVEEISTEVIDRQQLTSHRLEVTVDYENF